MDEKTEQICCELGWLADDGTRRSALKRYPELIAAEVVKQLAEMVRTAVRVDVRRALGLAEAALAIARELGTAGELALGMRAKANVLWVRGDCKSAVQLFREAVTLFEAQDDKNEIARTLSSSIQAQALLGEYDRAFADAERARQIFTNLGDSWRVARLEINVANIYHRQNRYSEALAVYERAYNQLIPHRDVEGISAALHNIAVCLIALDDFSEALVTYQRVRDLCQEHNMPRIVGQADYNVAFLHYLRGDYNTALELLSSTREACKQSGDIYHLGLCELDRSEIYLELSLIDEAAGMAQSGFERFEHLGMGFESARALTNLAIACSLQSNWSRALELFSRAKEIALRENNQVWSNVTDLYRALVVLDQGEYSEARDLAAPAAEFFRESHMHSKRVLCLLVLTRVYLLTNEIEQAACCCAQAAALLETLDTPILSYQARFLRGQIHEAQGQDEQAYDSYQASRAELETLRSSLQREEFKLGFMRNRLGVYDRLIQMCLKRASAGTSVEWLQRDPLEEALSYVEAAKCRTLRDLILGDGHRRSGGPEESQIDCHFQELRKELNWYYHRIEHEQLSQKPVRLEEINSLRLQAKIRENELMRLLLEAPNPGAIGVALRNSSAATLEEIRSALPAEAALLEYFVIGEQAFAAVVTASVLKIVPLGASISFAHRLRRLQFQLSKFRLNGEYIATFHQTLLASAQTHLRELYDSLIGPLADLLCGYQDLAIIPFGPLHSLPFHALFDGSAYLIDKFSICYGPSASIFVHGNRAASRTDEPSLVLGVSDDRTPFINEEIQAVAAVLPEPRVLLGPDATEDALRNFGKRSRIIHIASHGFFRQDNPMFSSIKLADSYLTLYDLYHMDLPADLLALSGCVTGLNVVAGGEELLGLTRGLLYAGARSLLLSLWEIDDRSTSELMSEFYGGMKRHPRKADALREAMIALRKRYPHPYYWAPFKLIGNAFT